MNLTLAVRPGQAQEVHVRTCTCYAYDRHTLWCQNTTDIHTHTSLLFPTGLCYLHLINTIKVFSTSRDLFFFFCCCCFFQSRILSQTFCSTFIGGHGYPICRRDNTRQTDWQSCCCCFFFLLHKDNLIFRSSGRTTTSSFSRLRSQLISLKRRRRRRTNWTNWTPAAWLLRSSWAGPS